MLNIPTQGDGSTGSVSASAAPGTARGKPSLRLHRVYNSTQMIAKPARAGPVDAATGADPPGRIRASTTLAVVRQPLPRPRQIEHMIAVRQLKQNIALLKQCQQKTGDLIAEMCDLNRHVSERYLGAAAERSTGTDPLPLSQTAPDDTVAAEQAARSAQAAEQHQNGACCVIL